MLVLDFVLTPFAGTTFFPNIFLPPNLSQMLSMYLIHFHSTQYAGTFFSEYMHISVDFSSPFTETHCTTVCPFSISHCRAIDEHLSCIICIRHVTIVVLCTVVPVLSLSTSIYPRKDLGLFPSSPFESTSFPHIVYNFNSWWIGICKTMPVKFRTLFSFSNTRL